MHPVTSLPPEVEAFLALHAEAAMPLVQRGASRGHTLVALLVPPALARAQKLHDLPEGRRILRPDGAVILHAHAHDLAARMSPATAATLATILRERPHGGFVCIVSWSDGTMHIATAVRAATHLPGDA